MKNGLAGLGKSAEFRDADGTITAILGIGKQCAIRTQLVLPHVGTYEQIHDFDLVFEIIQSFGVVQVGFVREVTATLRNGRAAPFVIRLIECFGTWLRQTLVGKVTGRNEGLILGHPSLPGLQKSARVGSEPGGVGRSFVQHGNSGQSG